MTDDRACAATPPAELERQIMDSNIPKNEREWWAAREIERLRSTLPTADSAVTEGMELKPCPFCGCAPRIVEPHESDRSIEGETDDEEWLSFIECDCVDMFFVKGSATSQDEARQSVIDAWNRRALSAALQPPKVQDTAPVEHVVGISPDHIEELRRSAAMIRRWIPETFPENELGQVHFARAVIESVASTIERALGIPDGSDVVTDHGYKSTLHPGNVPSGGDE
jgi:Lar family restriction alleviation protein